MYSSSRRIYCWRQRKQLTMALMLGVVSDARALLFFLVGLHQTTNGVENIAEVVIIFALEFHELSRQRGMGCQDLSQSDKRPHDLYIHLDSSLAFQDTGK